MPKGTPLTNEYVKDMKFARMTVVRIASRTPVYSRSGLLRSVKTIVEALCECGNIRKVSFNDLRNGHTRSCGCFNIEKIIERSTKHGHARRTVKSKEWVVWAQMNQRCYDANTKSFERYGGRGIRVCDRWRGPDGYANFFADMGHRPTNEHSIERRDNSMGYSPQNCVWADRLTQGSNKRNNVIVNWEGSDYTLSQLLRHLGIGLDRYSMYHGRIKRGWSIERAISGQPEEKSIRGVLATADKVIKAGRPEKEATNE